MMKIKHWFTNPFVRNAGGLALATCIKQWMGTLDYKTVYHDKSVDPALADLSRRRHIYIFWHEYIPYQLYLRGNCRVCMLLSANRDAELLSRAAMHMGFATVRGSTYSAPRRALRGLIRYSRDMHLTLTPDGPRGPRRVMSPGPIYLSSKLQIPLVLLGMGYDRPWRLNSWDRFAVPRPYSRARCVFSEAIQIPPHLTDGQLEVYRQDIETQLNELTDEAESWATSGRTRAGQSPTRRSARVLPQHRAVA
jgi:lysophospholipid acyltransferase (LPLAT)-like uncharacterized protein